MDKKQFEAKKAIIDKHIKVIDAVMADIEKEFAESQRAEAETPKLRHGDIRQWGCSDGCVGIVDLSEPAPHVLWPGDDLRNSKTQDVILSRSKSIGNLKDIFDDLKATQEDLTEFTLGKGLRENTVYLDAYRLIIRPEKPGSVIVDIKDLPAFIRDIRAMYATYLRRKNAKDNS